MFKGTALLGEAEPARLTESRFTLKYLVKRSLSPGGANASIPLPLGSVLSRCRLFRHPPPTGVPVNPPPAWRAPGPTHFTCVPRGPTAVGGVTVCPVGASGRPAVTLRSPHRGLPQPGGACLQGQCPQAGGLVGRVTRPGSGALLPAVPAGARLSAGEVSGTSTPWTESAQPLQSFTAPAYRVGEPATVSRPHLTARPDRALQFRGTPERLPFAGLAKSRCNFDSLTSGDCCCLG